MNALTSAIPSRARLPLGAALILAILAADAFAYDAAIGLGFALYLCALAALAGLSAPEPVSRERWSSGTAMQLAAVLPLVLQSNVLTIAIALVGTLAVALWLRGTIARGWGSALAEVAVQTVIAPVRFVPLVAHVVRTTAATSPRANPLVWIVPVGLAAVFVALFADANPIIARVLDAIDVAAFLTWLFSDRLWAWIGFAVLSAPFLHPAVRQSPRLKMLLGAFTMLRPVLDDETRLRRRWSEAGFAARCLLLFNAVFAVQTASDLLYLHAGFGLPDGMSYAAYAHRGAYPLLATAVLAGLFVVWTTRPDGPASTSPLVTRLVLVWIAQNVLLLLSSVMRLDLYVDSMGLTYWRVAAFIWMGLTGAGFLLVLVRGFRGYSLGWLVSANALVLAGTLYAASLVDWADVIARSQLSRPDGGRAAIRYASSIGTAALPAFDDLREAQPERGNADERCEWAKASGRLRRKLSREMHGSGMVDRFEWRALTARRRALAKHGTTTYRVGTNTCRRSDR